MQPGSSRNVVDSGSVAFTLPAIVRHAAAATGRGDGESRAGDCACRIAPRSRLAVQTTFT